MPADPPARPGRNPAVRRFFDTEAAGGLVLIGAAALALLAANSAAAGVYHRALQAAIGPMTVHAWINEALMALFFLLVGLEIKREFLVGELSSWERRRLPLLAAGSGMLVPAAIYLAVAWREPVLAGGWAIPAATDIAFALGVLALLGSRAPASLKLFLATVAIADDLGAVAIVAIAYTDALDWPALAAAAAILVVLCALGRRGVRRPSVYLAGAALLWVAVLHSGVHATVAGVLAAVAIPIAADEAASPLHWLEHTLAPWVAFLIVPLFGFANAGVSLEGIGAAGLLAPLPLAVAAGLFLGKQLGIFGGVWLSVKLGLAAMPRGAGWLQIYGVAMLCGIGFTMSLFIGALAFPGRPDLVEAAKLGTLAGSALSALAGFLVLRFAPSRSGTEELSANA